MAYFGLTGGIACGKSTAARAFASLGAKIIDADGIGHEVIRAPGEAYQRLVLAFGRGILDASGEIDRGVLGRIVFSDPDRLRELNSIVHPRIIARTEKLAREYKRLQPDTVVLVDAALIFEAGIGGQFRKVVVVWCQPELQLERLMAKAGLAREEAQRRIAVQIPVEEKRRRADFAIDSSGTLENTFVQVRTVYGELSRLVREEP